MEILHHGRDVLYNAAYQQKYLAYISFIL